MNARLNRELFYTLQIQMAARGSITGTLTEWPALRDALKWRGFDLRPDTPAVELRRICQDELELAQSTTHQGEVCT